MFFFQKKIQSFSVSLSEHKIINMEKHTFEDKLIILKKDIEKIVNKKDSTQMAYFAGGCFWGVEYMMQKEAGVLDVVSGYMGGNVENPTYEQVCTGSTGHAEVVCIIFEPSKVSYETLAKLFFEIHNPEQIGGQGTDIGDQYRSEIFYIDENQKKIIEKLIATLQQKGYNIATKLSPASTFWKAENYHQNYYQNKGTLPYCHAYEKRF